MSPLASSDQPVYALPEENLVPVSDHLTHMAPIAASRIFLLRQSLEVYRQKYPDSPVYLASQGDGGASLPGVPREILERAAQIQIEHGTGYDEPSGTDEYKRAVIEKYWEVKPELGYSEKNVMAVMGGRDGLAKAYDAMLALGHGREGDVVVFSRVPWVSYTWGPYALGANVMYAPGREEDGWAHTEDGIQACVDLAAKSGRKVAGVVITSPENPTGLTYTAQRQAELGNAALAAGAAFVFYDWMYHYVTDEKPMDLNTFLPLFTPQERERLIFMDGITKSLGASNIRNCHLIASKAVIDFMSARTSHTYVPSFFSMAVAMAAYEMGFENASRPIIEPINISRRWMEQFLKKHDFTYILGKGYYAFIRMSKWLKLGAWEDSEPLVQYLAGNYGMTVVPGSFFSPYGREWVRYSYATPLERTQGAAQRMLAGLKALEGK